MLRLNIAIKQNLVVLCCFKKFLSSLEQNIILALSQMEL